MTNCNRCKKEFNGTPRTWDFTDGFEVHVDCNAKPPMKPKLCVADIGASALPPAPRSAVAKYLKPEPTNRTLGWCRKCGRNVQSVDAHQGTNLHVDCEAAAQRMDRNKGRCGSQRKARSKRDQSGTAGFIQRLDASTAPRSKM